MSSSVAKTSKYSYRSTNGGNADVSIEYSTDLSGLSRLEVSLEDIPETGGEGIRSGLEAESHRVRVYFVVCIYTFSNGPNFREC